MKKNKNISLGSWITLAHPAIAEIMANAGFEWLVIDLEHSVITIREAEELIRIISLCNVKPYVRLTANDSNQIKRVLDAGAQGIIVPMVNSATQALKAAEAMFYPPKGKRGVGLARAQGYGANFTNYVETHNDLELIVQIEHIDAVKRLGEILSVPSISGFIVGPYDLSGSMGKPGDFKDDHFKEVLNKIKLTANQYPTVKRGIHLVEPDEVALKNIVQNEYDFIAYSLDTRILDVGIRKGITQFKELNNGSSGNYSITNGCISIPR